MKMEQTQCSETSAIKHHTLENNPKGYTRHTENGESLKSRMLTFTSIKAVKGFLSVLHNAPAPLCPGYSII
jgi:hypothetical protein